MMTINNVAAINNNTEAITKMTKTEINDLFDLKLSDKELKKIKKNDLVEMASNKVVSIPIVPAVESVVKEEKVVEKKTVNVDTLTKALAREYVNQSLNQKWALFYKGTKVGTEDYLVKTSKLWGATKKVLYKPTPENIQNAINKMVTAGYISTYSMERTFVVIDTTNVDQSIKDLVNGLVKSKDITWKRNGSKEIKLIAVTDAGKKAINEQWPNVCYKATRDQMNAMFKISR